VSIPDSVWASIAARNASYPIPWNAFDLVSPWLGVYRLFLFADFDRKVPAAFNSSLSLAIDGSVCSLVPSFNAPRGRNANTLNGFIADVVKCGWGPDGGKRHNVSLAVHDAPLGSFMGLYFDGAGNVQL